MRTKTHFRSSLLRTRKAHRCKPLNTTQDSWVTKKWRLALELNYHLSLKGPSTQWVDTRYTRARLQLRTALWQEPITAPDSDESLIYIEEYKKSLVVLSIDLKIKAFWKASFSLQTINLFLVRWKPWFFLRRFHLRDPPYGELACSSPPPPRGNFVR